MRCRLTLLALLIAGPAFAAEPASPTPAEAPMSTAEQIDAFIRSSPARAARTAETDIKSVVPAQRRAHGEVSVGVGTRGYRSIYMRSDIPIGETGTLSVAVENSRFNGRRGDYGPESDGGGFGFGAGSPLDRQRCDLEALTPPRPMDEARAGNARCLGRSGDR